MNAWQHGQHEALWGDPAPTTPEGQLLWRLFNDGKLGTSASGIRDFGQRVCQIEAEAAASVRAELRVERAKTAGVLGARDILRDWLDGYDNGYPLMNGDWEPDVVARARAILDAATEPPTQASDSPEKP